MKRVMAIGAAATALFVWLEVGAAQQASTLRFRATASADLRTWDQYVTAQERAGTLRVRQVTRDPSLPARAIERLQQYHQGVPVWGAEVVRDSERGVPTSIFGELSAAPDVDTRPALTREAATERLSGSPGATLLRPVALVVLRLESGEHRLAYTSVVSRDNQVDRVFVDAASGVELLRFTSIHTQGAVGTGRGVNGDTKKMAVLTQSGTYLADDQLRPPVLTTFDMRGNFLRSLNVAFLGAPLFLSDVASDTDNNWSDGPVVDAHAYIGWTYDYFFKRHGRRGLDNQDRPLIALVNPITPQAALALPPELLFGYAANAFWCDDCGPGAVGVMFFGNGIPPNVTTPGGQTVAPLSGAIDVVAHELSHGVISSSSNLIYMNESGALNEAFSDIMGTAVEFFFQPVGGGIMQADYLIGEDSFRSPAGVRNGIRSMVNPVSYGYPDHYSIRFTGPQDGGGVHINSSIVNHAFYLAVEGGRHRLSGVTVQGVGAANREQMERVFYRAFVFLLPASAEFSTARASTIQAARDLYGANSAAATAITQAWTAVGVN